MAQEQQRIESLCKEIYEPLVRAMILYASDQQVGEDAAHDALVKLVVQLRDGKTFDNPAGWAYRVATNQVHGVGRRRSIRERLNLSPPQASDFAIEDGMVLRRALSRLPRRQRAAVVARYELGLSVRETAASLKCSEGTVRALTHQAATALRSDSSLKEGGA